MAARTTGARKATGTRKAAAPKADVPKTLADKIPAAVRDELAKAILNFDEPGICPEGRRRFLRENGFNVKRTVTVGDMLIVEVEDDDLEDRSSYYKVVKKASQERITKDIKDALGKIGVTLIDEELYFSADEG